MSIAFKLLERVVPLAEWVFGKGDGSYEATFELTPSEKAAINVVVSSTEEVQLPEPAADMSSDMFKTTPSESYRAFNPSLLQRCTFCPATTVHTKWRFVVPRDATTETVVNLGDNGVLLIEAFWFMLPVLCVHHLEKSFSLLPSHGTATSIGFPVPRKAARFNYPLPQSYRAFDCPHDVKTYKPPATHDALGEIPQDTEMYRPEETLKGNRCCICNPGSHHFWSERLQQALAFRRVGRYIEIGQIVLPLVRAILTYYDLPIRPVSLSVTASSENFPLGRNFSAPTKDLFVIRETQDDSPVPGFNSTTVVFPVVRGPRCFAMWRLLLADAFPYGTEVFVVEAQPDTEPPVASEYPKLPPLSWVRLNGRYPALGLSRIVAGALYSRRGWSLTSVMNMCDVYGADEHMLCGDTGVLALPLTGISPSLCGSTFPEQGDWQPTLFVAAFIGDKWKVVSSQRSRAGLAVASSMLAVVSPESLSLELPVKGEFIEAGVRDFSRPARDFERGFFPNSARSHILVFVSLGTKGDRTPFYGILRYLAGLGFIVFHIPSVTQEEGKLMLDAAENGITYKSMAFYFQALAGVASIPFLTFAPYYLGTADVPISFEAPSWAVRPSKFGNTILGALVVQGLFGGNNVLRVGSWPDVDSVPRSTDGFSFDVPYVGGTRPVRALYAPGSTSLRFNVPGAHTIQPGDHTQQFRKAQIAYVVGAGTAQTAAAAGCRVVALSKAIDRDFVNPQDVGRGMKFGITPRRVLLHLMEADPVYFRILWGHLGIFDYPFAARFFITRHGMSIMYWLIALSWFFMRRWRNIRLGPGLLQTIILTFLPWRPGFFDYVLVSSFGGIFTVALQLAQIDPFLFVIWAIRMGIQQSMNPVFFYLESSGYSWTMSFLLAYLIRLVAYPLVVGVAAMFGASAAPEVYLHVRFFYVNWFPVVHTKFVNADLSLKAEGHFLGDTGAFVPYEYRVTANNKTSDGGSFCLVLPTALSWKEIEGAHVRPGRYSLWFNCQTMVLKVAGASPFRLGVGVLVLIPTILWMFLSFFSLFVFSAILTFVLPVLAPVVILSDKSSNSVLAGLLAKVAAVLHVALLPGLPWMVRLQVTLAEAHFSWGSSKPMTTGQLNFLYKEAIDLPTEDSLLVSSGKLRQKFFDTFGEIPSQVVTDAILTFIGALRPSTVPERTHNELADLLALLSLSQVPFDFYEACVQCSDLENFPESSDDDSMDYKAARLLLALLAEDEGPLEDYSKEGAYPVLLRGLMEFGYAEVPEREVDELVQSLTVKGSKAERLIRYFFFNAEELTPDQTIALSSEVLTDAGAIVATLVDAGADFEDALNSTCQELAAFHQVEDGVLDGTDAAVELFTRYMAVRDSALMGFETFTQWFLHTRAVLMKHNVPFFAPVEFSYLLAARTTAEIAKLSSFIVSPLLRLWSDAVGDPALRDTLAIAFASFLDIVDLRHRHSPKPAWALLLGKMKYRLGRGDAMFAAFTMTSYDPPADYVEWADRMKAHMAKVDPIKADSLWSRPPTRQLFFPSNTYGIKDHEKLIEFFDVNIHETNRERKMLETAIKHGGSEAIDQAWLSTPLKMDVSLSRYLVDRPEPSLLGKDKILEAADSIYDDFTEMYDAPRGMTVKNVIHATEWKYSAGLPFLPIVKKRVDLKNTDWIRVVAGAAESILDSGHFPGIGFHCFPKNQLVALDKLVAGKPIRTVTAGDRLTAIAYNTVAMERNKRVPPTRALVLPAFTRTEGGMASVYKELSTLPNYFVGDGEQFDSTVCSTLVVEGPTRLWERGLHGNWGERAVSSFIRSYYEAISTGLLVSLIDGKTTVKTGGGGTGSAATSPDNRDWVRICFRASWSIAFDLPCSHFKDHVKLANASDDVAFTCDDMTVQGINKWKEIMRAEYGVAFNFEQPKLFDGILHLRLVEEPDFDMYAELGMQPNQVIVRHDPAKLFTMRSEYRADRMKHTALVSYDVIATRSVGHAYLTAHNRIGYSDIALDWEEAVTSMMTCFFTCVEVERGTDENGNIVSSSISIANINPSERLLNAAAKYHPSQQGHYIKKQQAVMRRWLRAHRLPSYRSVFELWVSPPKERSAAMVRYHKLPVTTLSVPAIDLVRTGLISSINAVRMIPRAIQQIGGEIDVYSLAPRFTTSDFPIERYLYWRATDRLGRPPSHPELVSLVRQSPFGSSADPWGFLVSLQDPNRAKAVLQANIGQKSTNFVQVALILCVYTVSDVFLRRLSQTRLLGTLLVACLFFLKDIDIFYSFVGLIYWVATGTASLAISNLSTRDPYLVLKLFSITCVQALPSNFEMPAFIWTSSLHLAWPVEVMTMIQKSKTTVADVVQQQLIRPQNPMTYVAHQVGQAIDGLSGFRVWAGMGSGKSTLLVAELLAQPTVDRVILLCPTRLLVNNYENDWVRKDHIWTVQSEDFADRMVPISGLIVMTHAMFCALHATLSAPVVLTAPFGALGITQSDVILVDEVGSDSIEAAACFVISKMLSPKLRVGGLTGTPVSSLAKTLEGTLFQVPPRIVFSRTIQRAENDDIALMVSTAASTWPSLFNRALIVLPSISHAEKMAHSVGARYNVTATAVTSMQPYAPPNGVVVGTSIVDIGVNIRPAPQVMVDSGLTIVQLPSDIAIVGANKVQHNPKSLEQQRNELYHYVTVNTPLSVHEQRMARVGRERDGFVLTTLTAGTGTFETSMLSIGWLVSLSPYARREVRALLSFSVDVHDRAESGTAADFWSINHALLGKLNVKYRALSYQIIAFYALASEVGGLQKAREIVWSGMEATHAVWCRTLSYFSHSTDYRAGNHLTDPILSTVVFVVVDDKKLYGRLIRYDSINRAFVAV